GFLEEVLAREGREKSEVARARLVESGQQAVDDAKRNAPVDPQSGDARARLRLSAVLRRGSLQRSDDARPHRDHAAVLAARLLDRLDRRIRDVVALRKREERIRGGITDRRESGGVSDRRERDPLFSEFPEQLPSQRQTGRRRLDRPWARAVGGLKVPEGQSVFHVRVLDRPSALIEEVPEIRALAIEPQIHETRRKR